MGKPTGFLEYERETSESVDACERIKNFNEFHEFLPKEKQQQQLFFDLLMYEFRTLRDENQGSLQTVYNQALADLLQAKMKLNSNVAFQNVIEQFVLHFLQQ